MSRKSARKSRIMNLFGQPPLTTQVVRRPRIKLLHRRRATLNRMTTLNKRIGPVITPVRIASFGVTSLVIKWA